ncbi:hypothetical protein FQN50_003741 [Emmonsiellopsis sp. PD_5]|nr:hypothetical protein FQN50_003741 [Emmonsiellopsis sp. PD_5]
MGLPPPTKRPYTDSPPLSSSAASAHSLQPYNDLEPDDSPPAYTDADADTANDVPSAPAAAATSSHPNLDFGPPAELSTVNERVFDYYAVPGGRPIASKRKKTTGIITLDPSLSTDAEALHSLIANHARRPPVPMIYVKGTHTVTHRTESSGKGGSSTTRETVVDFDFRINCANSVLPETSLVRGDGESWVKVDVVGDGDGERAWRGGRVRSKGRGRTRVSVTGATEGDVEEGQALNAGGNQGQDQGPGLEEWCRRFCEDKAGVRSFTFTRTLSPQTWNQTRITTGLTSLIRSLNYRGHITITSHLHNASLKIYTPHPLNRLRTNPYIWWTCVLLQLWLLTWPLLILLERRYEPIHATWYAWYHDQYACGMDEEAWLGFFENVVRETVMGRGRGGEVVGFREAVGANRRRERVERGEGVEEEVRQETEAERQRRERVERGEGNWADSLVGVVRGVAEVRRDFGRRSDGGWGGDC